MGEKLPPHHLVALKGKLGLRGYPRRLRALRPSQLADALRRNGQHGRLLRGEQSHGVLADRGGGGDGFQTAALAADAGLAAASDDRDVADLGALLGHAVPDLAVDGQGRADAVLAAQEKLRALRLVVGEEHMRGKESAHVVRQHGAQPCQRLHALAEGIARLGEGAEAVGGRPAVQRGHAPNGDAHADDLPAREPVLLRKLHQPRAELLYRRLGGVVALQRILLGEDYGAVQPDGGEHRLRDVDHQPERADVALVELHHDLPPPGGAAGDGLALDEQPLAQHFADDLGDRGRGELHALRQTLAGHLALFVQDAQDGAAVVPLDAHHIVAFKRHVESLLSGAALIAPPLRRREPRHG